MSARVFNPLVMSEMPRMFNSRSGNNSTTGGRLDGTTLAKVKRSLFGTASPEDVNKDFVEKELAAIQKSDSERWNFDFVSDKPLNNVNARYVWERISPHKYIPKAYASRGFQFISQNVENTTAEEENTHVGNNNAVTSQQKTRPRNTKQSHIADYLKSRKRSLSGGDVVTVKKFRPVVSSSTVSTTTTTRKSTRTRNS